LRRNWSRSGLYQTLLAEENREANLWAPEAKDGITDMKGELRVLAGKDMAEAIKDMY
jgi:hypothetical protein